MEDTGGFSFNRRFQIVIFCLLLLGFTYAFVMNAWVVDDAYITFRTVDNFLNGYGLTWNVDERVQAYTHPLWMFVITFFSLFAPDVFYTCLVVSYGFCLAVFFVMFFRFKSTQGAHWKPILILLLLLSSKAFIDYTSSGLETPLSYFLATVFFCSFLQGGKVVENLDSKKTFFLFLVAALSFFNRQDTILLYLPALLYVIILQAPQIKFRLIPMIVFATLPATGWLLFSLIYYGFPYPNTAYAKLMCNNISADGRVLRGLEYLHNSITWDAWSYVILLGALLLACLKKNVSAVLAVAGVLIYYGYVVVVAAAATHMSGRFFAVPILVAALIFVTMMENRKIAVFIGISTVLFIVFNPVSAFKMGTPHYKPYNQSKNYIDTSWWVHNEGAALINWKVENPLPAHPWFHQGLRFSQTDQKVHVSGADGRAAIGYFGYAAGPEKFIVDRYGLSDPLLARLLPESTKLHGQFQSGHFSRSLPPGYIESLEHNKMYIEDPDMRKRYEKIRNVTRGPIWRLDRFADVWDLNKSACQQVETIPPLQK